MIRAFELFSSARHFLLADRIACGAVAVLFAAQYVALHQVGADVAVKKLDFLSQMQGAAGRQVGAVVDHDVGVLHQVVLQMQRRIVQPWNPGVDEKGSHRLVDAHQIQGVGDELDMVPLPQWAQGGGQVVAVVQDTDQWFAGARL